MSAPSQYQRTPRYPVTPRDAAKWGRWARLNQLPDPRRVAEQALRLVRWRTSNGSK